MKQWAVLASAMAALALAAACGSKSSGNDQESSDDGGGSSSGSSSGNSSGSAPVIALEAGSTSFLCQSMSDCDGGELCCGTLGVTSATSSCTMGPCPTGGTAGGLAGQLCASSDECPAGNSCLPLSESAGASVNVCIDDDAGSAGFGEGDGSVFIVEAGAPPKEAGTVDATVHEVDASVTDAGTAKEAGPVDAASPKDAAEGVTEAGPHDAASGG
jgi:hypothetical protein